MYVGSVLYTVPVECISCVFSKFVDTICSYRILISVCVVTVLVTR